MKGIYRDVQLVAVVDVDSVVGAVCGGIPGQEYVTLMFSGGAELTVRGHLADVVEQLGLMDVKSDDPV